MFEHAANLAILALGQRQLDPLIAPRPPLEIGIDLAIADPVDLDPVDKFLQLRLADVAKRAGAIGALDPAGGQFELALEFAVIGQQQQALGIIVEPPDGHQPRQPLGQHVINRIASLGVARRGQAADRLVEAIEARRYGLCDRIAVDGQALER